MNDEVFRITTKFGWALLRPTQKDHIFVDLDQSTDNPDGFVLRGVRYHGHVHVYLWADGDWHIGPEFKDDRGHKTKTTSYDQRQYVWLKRSDWLSKPSGQDMPSESARTLMVDTILIAVNHWAFDHPMELLHAESAHIQGKINSQERKCEELHDQWTKEAQELQILRDQQKEHTRLVREHARQKGTHEVPQSQM